MMSIAVSYQLSAVRVTTHDFMKKWGWGQEDIFFLKITSRF